MIRPKTLLLAAIFAVAPAALMAASLALPTGAILRDEQVDAAGTYPMPIGPWSEDTGIELRQMSGLVTRQAWRIGGTGLSSYQILLTLREQLASDGYTVLFECEASACGGFDFRFGTEVIGEPMMHIDLGDYYYLAAERPGADNDAVTLMVSRSASAGFVQIVQVGKLNSALVTPLASTKAEPGTAMPVEITTDIGPAMEDIGRFVLGDLVFETGSAELGPGDFQSLHDLADYLGDNPNKRVALVGHTDAQGSLEGNISLSKRRAQSVLDRLVQDYGVSPAQLEAGGIGYLAPLASNQTEDGRQANRRVEAILTSTE